MIHPMVLAIHAPWPPDVPESHVLGKFAASRQSRPKLHQAVRPRARVPTVPADRVREFAKKFPFKPIQRSALLAVNSNGNLVVKRIQLILGMRPCRCGGSRRGGT